MHGVLSKASEQENRIPTFFPSAAEHSSQGRFGEPQAGAAIAVPDPGFPFRPGNWHLERPSPTEIHERMAVATVAADIGIWDLDVLANSFHCCHRCAKIFGTALDSATWYEDFLQRVHVEDKVRVHRAVQAALDPMGTGIYDEEYRIAQPDGEVRWIAANGKAFFEQVHGVRTAVRFLGTLLDRTAETRARAALMESEKLAITGRLAASIAHEIRNPLEAVTNLLYILRHETAEDRRDMYLSLAETEMERLHEIASNTLHFYRDPAERTKVDIPELIDSVLLLFRARIAELQVRVETEFASGIAVEAPRGELRQVFVNLIGNALDAMQGGGRLIVRARRLTGCDGRGCVRLSVADTGHGMAPEVMARIFTAFYTTKGGSGTGIGLWLSREIVQKCGSRMRVKSFAGRGTVFSFCLQDAGG